jgi:hypothetical protein
VEVVTRMRRGGSHEHQATVWLGGRLPWTSRAGVTGGSHVCRAARSRSIVGRYLSASSSGPLTCYFCGVSDGIRTHDIQDHN